MEEIISCSHLVDHQEATANEENETYKLRVSIGHQRPPKAPNPNLKRCKYNVLVEWETGEKTHEPLPVLAADDPVTCASYTKGNGISHLDGWKRYKNLAKRDKHDLPSLASLKGEMKGFFSWTSLSKTPTSSTLCFSEPTLGNFNKETEFCITIHITFGDSIVHTGTTLSVPSSSSEICRVSDCHSNLVTTPSSRMILDKLKLEVTKDPTHHVGKNGEDFIKSNQHLDILPEILPEFSKCVRASFNHGLRHSDDDWGDPKGELTKMVKYISNGCMLMEVDWGGNLKLNYTSCECMLMEVDWGGKLIVNSMVDWGAHGTHPNGHNISEVDWGGYDSSSNHMNEFLLSEVDWGAHDSSFFLFLVNIDYDAKQKDFSTQKLWGELSQKTSSSPLIGLNHVEGKLVHHLAPQKCPNLMDHQLDQQWDPTQSLDHLLSSSDPDLCPSPCLSLMITVLLVGHSYYLPKNIGRNLTSTSLMAYVK